MRLPTETACRHVTPTRCIVSTVLVVAAAVSPHPAAAVEDKVITESFSASSIPAGVTRDFGTIVEGQNVVLELVISNDGDSELQIGAVRPLCACMTQEADHSVAPGQSGTITLSLETIGYSGPTTEAALIQWVDSLVPVTRAEMTMTVQPVLEVLPHKLVRFRAIEGKAKTEEVEIRRADGKPFKVKEVTTDAEFLTVKVTPGEASYRLAVTLGADAPNGLVKGTIFVNTDLPTLPKLEIKVTGLVGRPRPAADAPATRD